MNNLKLPEEVYDFFDSQVGRSLMIKGHAGVGKTIMSLTMLEEIGDLENSFYFSTRVSNQSLYSQFGWLREKDMRENLIDASHEFLSTIKPAGEKVHYFKERKSEEIDEFEKVDSARRLLTELRGEDEEELGSPASVSRSMLINLRKENFMAELENIYDRVEARLPEPTLFIIDSLESLAERYEIEPEVLIKTLQKDLVERSRVNLILVLESEKYTKMDYLVDGVITLKESEKKGRRVRQLYLNKLRGVKIKRPVYIFTLNEGKFRYFKQLDPITPTFENRHPPIEDGEGTDHWENKLFSTGSIDLDNVLGGGYPRDGLVVIEVGKNIPFIGQMYLFGPTMENFLTQGRGVLVMPSSGKGEYILEDWARGLLEKEEYENIKILDFGVGDKRSKERKPEYYMQKFKEAYKELRYETGGGPILTVCDWIRLEHSIGGEDIGVSSRLRIAKDVIDLMRENSALTIGLMGPGFTFKDKSRYISDTHIKIFTYYNTLLMYGEKPNTEIYNVYLSEGEHPKAELMPLV